MKREEGAGTALAVALVAALVVVLTLFATLAVVLEARQRAADAADSAALGAGDVALGDATGTPCDRAGDLVAEDDAELVSCEQRGLLVRVRTVVAVLGFRVDAVAVAGPPR